VLLGEATRHVTIIQQGRLRIDEAFYDMGLAFRALQRRPVLDVLGVTSFDELCRTVLRISASFARQLVAVVERMSRDEALALGESRAIAIVAIKD
jgi:hypothetical protein